MNQQQQQVQQLQQAQQEPVRVCKHCQGLMMLLPCRKIDLSEFHCPKCKYSEWAKDEPGTPANASLKRNGGLDQKYEWLPKYSELTNNG